uniref:Adenylyltransferase and sulfurtransferase MOCS3 homolog n=1 Tax=Caenorhabditis tropicalis TaxID=1561998 RepID=A0A1I7UEE1_9PELO
MDENEWVAGISRKDAGRYSRQLLVDDFGVNGQKNLKSSKVLIVGAGGLGCPVATYLGAAGVGTLGIVDYDQISLDNLHRQVAYKETQVGQSKAQGLAEQIKSQNSDVNVVVHNISLDSSNAVEIFKNYNIVCDCTDNVATRYLINDVCVILNIPLVSGSALRWDGQLSVYHYGPDCPCFRCLFPSAPDPSSVTNCNEGGVLGPIVGTIGSMQALEVMKIAANVPSTLAGKLLLFDGREGKSRTIRLRKRDPKCAVCGDNPTITTPIDYVVFCGAGAHDKIEHLNLLAECDRVNVEEYRDIRKNQKQILLDTRPPVEFEIAHLPEAINVTLNECRSLPAAEISSRLGIDSSESNVYVICHRGNDSQRAVLLLREKIDKIRFRDIIGGYEDWANKINDKFPLY